MRRRKTAAATHKSRIGGVQCQISGGSSIEVEEPFLYIALSRNSTVSPVAATRFTLG